MALLNGPHHASPAPLLSPAFAFSLEKHVHKAPSITPSPPVCPVHPPPTPSLGTHASQSSLSSCLCFFLFSFLSSDSQILATLVIDWYVSEFACQVGHTVHPSLRILPVCSTLLFNPISQLVTGHVDTIGSEEDLSHLNLVLKRQY